MKYRADIDGLRTVAVLSVVLFHAGVAKLTGGFVGVDIFFVISGFLISNLIVHDANCAGFSILTFYERRVRRIFPALIVVILFCILAGYIIYAPDDYVRLGHSIPPVTLFFSNIYFWKSVSYFDPQADLNALLHTWSLSVEEQFYIFYPILLLMLHKWRLPARVILSVLALASLLLATVLVQLKPSAAFYLLPTRTWELMVGGIVAFWPRQEERSYTTELVASISGLVMIVVPVLVYDSATPFPGLAALPPVLGAGLIIWSGAGSRWTPVHRLLASRPMVFVGLASYSLYLWHFPLLAFTSYMYGGRAPLNAALVACAAAFALALLSLYVVEQPVRRRHSSARLMTVALPSAAMIAIAVTGVMIAKSNGLPGRLDERSARMLAVSGDRTRHHAECMSNGNVIVAPAKACVLGTAGATPHTLLWGDSHALVTATAMELAARRRGATLLFAATADCPIGVGFAISDTTERGLTTTPSYRYCGYYNEAMLARALNDHAITTVVLSSRWSNWRIGAPANLAESAVDLRLVDARGIAASVAGNRAIFERGFMAVLRRLDGSGKRVFIVAPVPEPPASVPEALYVQRFGLAPPLKELSLTDYQTRHASILAFFAKVHRELPAVRFIRPVAILCDTAGRCPMLHDGIPVYFDHNHLSVDAARRTAPLYDGVFAP
ncbi:peptidoglycan/LPS O-acetylase OafA/YrhL [Sphingomonas endophytica]|uniref:Peptidoglycan/LPS O-acetylase OafA/YrhL n=1 Tax=Sphingomonas endophytica TaxID=869719 RepID=A0A7X0JFI9_9SPHN|nr:acyltransferase family protein [Sphingomonas endophytica]MBB6506665.1 peptidoglycan/LPS O-acetylase OafA/YrhL [Sphingomonas endophytica]